MKQPRCPRCRKRPTTYTEIWDGTIQFDVDEHGVPEEKGNLEWGKPCSVEAECKCGHAWKLRGVTQITELRPDE